MKSWVESGGPVGPVVFVLLYVALTVLVFPA
ncbi:MAG: TVP38/TMEM64 family protein, partial [Thermoleophilaceae bacterium]|nr:TVP38/TMEM64 family protein [Thermoleophilaceae bacterium]